ncbi:MAG: alpha/beta hydrolase [Lachnospiraceae bacterium]|nr:alpha/beta hydrolase [Lachnospiraceae bacterium]
MESEKILKTESGDVHYWLYGEINPERKTLFFLHGLTANHKLFVRQTDYFTKEYNVISWDAPAHGKSRPFENFTYEKAAFAAKEILEENGIEKAVFIGQSMGGFITQSVLKRFPEIVEGFVSIDSCPYGEKYYSKSDKWWLRQVEWMAKLYPDKALRKSIAKQVSTTEDTYRNMLEMLDDYDKNELCHLMGIGYAGFLDDVSDLEIKCPLLLIVGDKDKTGRVIKYNMDWSEELGCMVSWIKNAAHNSNIDRPEEVNREIEKFLKKL